MIDPGYESQFLWYPLISYPVSNIVQVADDANDIGLQVHHPVGP
jgi:hypothetical protein